MNILRLNLKTKQTKVQDVPKEYLALGGRGLTSKIVLDEVEPTCNPLGKKNKIVIAPGLLSGTNAPSSGRVSIGSKSPLTGGIKESNSGGVVAQQLAKMGIKAIILEDVSDEWVVLKVTSGGISIDTADKILEKGNYEAGELLRQEYGNKVGLMTLGQAGENKYSVSTIAISDTEGRPVRHAGRGGLGAVMGSKKIKAIVIDPKNAEGITIKDKEAFKKASKAFTKMLLDHPVCGEGLPTYGSSVLVNILNESGGLPTGNFREGRFEGAEKISGETMYDTIVKRKGNPTHACHPGCVIRCSQVYNDENEEYLTAGFEYETIWAFGAHCKIDNLDAIAKMDRYCDDLGLDTIDMGVAMGVAMEAGILDFGDHKEAVRIFEEEIYKGTPLGRIFAQGAEFLGKAYGVTRIPTVKKQSIPAYDPRAVKGVGVTYATTPMGADHTAGYSVTANILNVGGSVDPLKKEGQLDLSRDLQVATAAVDSTGFCLFTAFAILDNEQALPEIVNMLNAQYGTELTVADVSELGKNVLRWEKAFNKEAGFTKADDRLPEFFDEDFAPHNVDFGFSGDELDSVLDF